MNHIEFLESTPLYVRTQLSEPPAYDDWYETRIQLLCETCRDERTFIGAGDIRPHRKAVTHVGLEGIRPGPRAGETLALQFGCAACRSEAYFLVVIGDDLRTVTKAGRWPPPGIRLDVELRTALGDDVEHFRKGRVAEEQGFGIGAYGYYRRVVENKIGALLDEVGALLPEDEALREALAKVRASHVAEDKIALVKDLLPASLKVGGANPLDLLYSTLSEGIHALPDEDCIDSAHALRTGISLLVTGLAREKGAKKEMPDVVKRLQARRDKKKP